LFVATIGARDAESEFEPDWLGAPMYWSGYDEATEHGSVRDALGAGQRRLVE